jgi:hypothetical protein
MSMTPLEEAQLLVGQDPLPIGIRGKIDELYSRAPAREQVMFVWIYEALDLAEAVPEKDEFTFR